MFGRKKISTAARERLKDPIFHNSRGVKVSVDYDPELWVRFPADDENQPRWASEVLTAYAEDFGWSAESPEYRQAAKMLAAGIKQPADYTAVFLRIFPADDFVCVCLDVLDEEGVLLKYGEPEKYLSFTDLDPKIAPSRSEFRPNRSLSPLDVGSHSGVDENQVRVNLTRLHRVLAERPALALIGSAWEDRRNHSHGQVLSLAYRTSVEAT